MNYYEEALSLRDELVTNRRWFHTNAEVGLVMPKGKAYVMEKLKEYGLDPEECGEGVIADIGKGGKMILLRADMDALPMAEESGEEFACTSGTEAHCCGHDNHAAMLLTAAKMLKGHEDELEGRVRFMFQTAEESFEGSRNMIEHGVLDGVDAALAYHVGPGRMPVGIYMYNDNGTMMFSSDNFTINIQGHGGHGAYPHTSIDPINIGVHIHLALQELIARESNPSHSCVLTIGKFCAGSAPNIIPDSVEMKGTIRTDNKEARDLLVRRLKEVTEAVAAMFGGSAEVIMDPGVPPLVCDGKLVQEILGYMQELPIPGATPYPGVQASASEDFALIAEKVPSAFMYLSAGFLDERGDWPSHNPKVRFNEDVLPIGAACLAHCAQRWLQNNK